MDYFEVILVYKRDLVSGLVGLLIFLVFTISTVKLPSDARYWPMLISVLGIVSCLILMAKSYYKMKSHNQEKTSIIPLSKEQIQKVFKILTLIIVLIIGIEKLGYLFSTIIFMLAFVLLFETERKRKIVIADIIIAVTFSIAMYIIFDVLGVQFPDGFLI